MIHELTAAALIQQFEDGSLPRDDYWQQMQALHRVVDGHRAVVRGDKLHHIEIHADELRLVLHNGLRFVWNPEDLRTAPSVIVNNGSYEVEESGILHRLARHSKVVFDIGANVGWFTLHFAQELLDRGGRVYAFEPIPTTAAMLQSNLDLNPTQAAIVHVANVALGNTETQTQFYIPAKTGSVAASQTALFPDDENIAVDVTITRLDTFVEDNDINQLDLLKADVEGAEYFVLKGGLSTIERFQPVIMVEMLRKWTAKYNYNPNDIIDLLGHYGYLCWYCHNGAFHILPHMTDTVEETNFFFLHNVKHGDANDYIPL